MNGLFRGFVYPRFLEEYRAQNTASVMVHSVTAGDRVPVAAIALDDATLNEASGRMIDSALCPDHTHSFALGSAMHCRACNRLMLLAALNVEDGHVV